MNFLRSAHVLVLLAVILAIEVVTRLGLYEPIVQPFSHSGVTITVKKALEKFGREEVNVLTIGDSRANQGLDNKLIYEGAREFGLNHLRASMPGSHFLTFKVFARWSIEELENLQGIVLAVSPEILGRLGNGAYETAKVLPLRNQTSVAELTHHIPFNRADVRTVMPFYSASGYREDIKDLLVNPAKRLALVNKRNITDPMHFLAFSNSDERDICVIPTADPAVCLDELEKTADELPDITRKAIRTLCRAAVKKPKAAVPGSNELALIDEWSSFLGDLSVNVRVLVVLLPDHSVFQDSIYLPNTDYVVAGVLDTIDDNDRVDVLDARDLIKAQAGQECSYFRDHRHLNMLGKEALTAALLPELEKFWAKLPGAARATAYW